MKQDGSVVSVNWRKDTTGCRIGVQFAELSSDGVTPALSPEGIAQFGEEYWQAMLDVPLGQLIECAKT